MKYAITSCVGNEDIIGTEGVSKSVLTDCKLIPAYCECSMKLIQL